MTTRRRVIVNLAAGAVVTALGGLVALPALAQSFSPSDLDVAGPLGDVTLGKADAPVTIIEYASVTCSHCATFHANTFPALKEKYIDTGKVRFILREFPLDPLATAGFMLARCAGNDKYYPVTDMLFDKQQVWAFSDKPLDALLQLMKQAGFTQESFEACLKDQKVYDAVNAVKNRGVETFGVNATPTFFINGQKQSGALTVEELDKILTPLVGG
ncbi:MULTISPECIES: DsbA family protein [unclassified Chelatococcus]|uniref:DsbA family protein n=1 Tax=unclassified Chelatococcus TaxID=2638111 RepID=UPI0003172830|nr:MULTISPECIES: DsbA family protein [unclassified Chelatococcus]ALA18157.1 disulfide bond formation protein DsbA [Chelatococcus sp. CO-6]